MNRGWSPIMNSRVSAIRDHAFTSGFSCPTAVCPRMGEHSTRGRSELRPGVVLLAL
jgi:hypothetical protein